jgi:serine/threonine-protein kinase
MSQPITDRNLLFGIIALQMDFISRDALIASMHAWVLEKSKPLGQILVEQGSMAEAERLLLEAVVEKHVEKHGTDVERSLSSLSPVGWIKADLQAIGDSGLDASLARLMEAGAGPATDPDRTKTRAAGPSPAGGPRFRILRPHAQGGLGEVYVARDEELNREVALKRIQAPYADDCESRARFLMEAEVTGGLEHPGVVPVYGLGHLDDGRPFYAMRFIRGESLKRAIADFHQAEGSGRDPGDRSLALRRLLGRFIDACNAVAYAHSRGVLHRDLKPGNIMLGPYGETLVVDWGLAKAMDRPQEPGPAAREATLRPASGSGFEPTRMGAAIGTPAYMSPEQAAGRLDELGPASDVYSLGATLYCLLTGRAPVEDSDAAGAVAAVLRGSIVPPRRVKADVPRALEAICLKAMAARPADRYPTPRHLADELEHWLADEPVSAAREPWWTRLRRWTRRHKPVVAGAAAVVATALAALAAGFVAVNLQKQETQRQRLRAEANFRKASDAVERLLTRIGQERLNDVPQMESLRSELLEDALQFQAGFLSERSDDPVVRFGVARAARMAANLQLQLNRLDEAERACRQALSILDELLGRSPRDLGLRRERASVLDTLGLTLATLDRADEAEAAYRKSIEVRSLIVMEEPGSAEDRWRMAACLNHLGILLGEAGRWDEAEHFFIRGRQLCAANPPSSPPDPRIRQALVATLGHLSQLLLERGRQPEALQGYAEAVRVQRAIVQASPRVSSDRELLVTLLLNQANALKAGRDAAEAERTLVEARDLAERLRADYPAIARYQDLAASVLNNLANAIGLDPPRLAEARDLHTRAIIIQERLVAMAPDVPDYLAKLATMRDSLANLLRGRGALDQAEALYRQELADRARLAAEHPQVIAYRFGHGQALHNLADLLLERGRPGDALPLEREALRQLLGVYRTNIRNPTFRMAASYAHWTLCSIHLALKDHRAAEAAVAEYLRIEPNGYEEASEAAGLLGRCARLGRDDPAVPAREREALARSYADRAMDALRTAVRQGYRDLKRLRTAPDYEPLRARDDFLLLLRQLEAQTEPSAGAS